MNEHRAKPSLARPTRALAIFAICAGLLVLSSCGQSRPASAGGNTSGSAQTVHDPENPYWRGYTGTAPIDASTGTGRATVRDPENPYWIGNTVSVPPTYADPVRGPR